MNLFSQAVSKWPGRPSREGKPVFGAWGEALPQLTQSALGWGLKGLMLQHKLGVNSVPPNTCFFLTLMPSSALQHPWLFSGCPAPFPHALRNRKWKQRPGEAPSGVHLPGQGARPSQS